MRRVWLASGKPTQIMALFSDLGFGNRNEANTAIIKQANSHYGYISRFRVWKATWSEICDHQASQLKLWPYFEILVLTERNEAKMAFIRLAKANYGHILRFRVWQSEMKRIWRSSGEPTQIMAIFRDLGFEKRNEANMAIIKQANANYGFIFRFRVWKAKWGEYG